MSRAEELYEHYYRYFRHSELVSVFPGQAH